MIVRARLRRARFVATLMGVLVALGCSAETTPSSPRRSSGEALARDATPSEGAGPDAPAPFDVAAVIDRVHFAYRPAQRAGIFATDHATYSVRAERAVISLIARHRPRDDAARSALPIESAPFRLEVSTLARGDAAAPPPSAPRVDADGGLVIARGTIEERYRNDDRGVEQSFALARAPRGDGDLVVRMRASGLDFRGVTETGLHFVDRAGGLGLRYGHGTFIDADGLRTAIPARYTDGEIALVVPDRVLDEARYPAVLDPILSPELDVDEPVDGPAPGAQIEPDVSRLGDGFVVVWSDNRRTPGDGDVYAARVDAAGVVLDPYGIVVSAASGSQHAPRVAGGPDGALVVWADDRAGWYDDLYGARLAVDGAVLDPDGIVISAHDEAELDADVAWNGTDYFVAWFDRRNEFHGDIFGAGITAAGVVSPSAVICDVPLGQAAPRTASNGADFFVVWQDERDPASSRDVYGTRVSASFVVQDADGVPITADAEYQVAPQVASVGAGYLVAWLDGRDGGNDVWSRPIDASGAPSGAETSLVTDVSVADGTPALGADGTQYLVAFSRWAGSHHDLYGARLDGDGVALGGEIAISTAPGDQTMVAVAGGGSGFFVVHQGASTGSIASYDIVGTRVGADGSVSPPGSVRVTTTANGQGSVALASNGASYLVVFTDARGGGHDVYAARLGPNGEMLDPLGIAVASDPALQEGSPAVASNGEDYLVVWSESAALAGPADVRGRIVQADGTLGAAAAIAVEDGYQRLPEVASAGASYYVVWQSYAGVSEDIEGTAVSAAGVVATPGGAVVCDIEGAQYFPQIAATGSSYFVVWDDYRGGVTASLYGAAIDAAGAIGTADGALIADGVGSAMVASDGSDFLVVWHRAAAGSVQLVGTTVAEDGALADPGGRTIGAFGTPSTFAGTTLTSNGLGYLYLGVHLAAPDTLELFGTRVHGAVAEAPTGYAMGALSMGTSVPTATSGIDGRYLLGYTRHLAEPPYSATRVRARLLELESTNGSRCGVGGECDSGHCVAGICCESACAGACQACSVATGSSADGVCAPRPEGEECDDASACTLVDACEAGACVGTGSPCAASTVCEDTPPDTYACASCAAGTYAPSGGTTCVPCDAGTYSEEGATSCTPCDAGTFSGPGATSCAPCDAGTYAESGAGSCAPCDAGSASAAGASACTTCDAGTAATAGAASCALCDAGTYAGAGAGSCASCPEGMSSGAGASACAPCDAGSSASAGASACAPCDAGTYAPPAASSCTPCADGTFVSTSGAASCAPWTACGAGEYEATPGSAIADRVCADCTSCGDGTLEVSPCTATSDAVCAPAAPDAGPDADAGSRDAGPTALDAGEAALDAEIPSADADTDGAVIDGGEPDVADGGCTCRAAGRPARGPRAEWLALSLLALLARRRARARGAPRA